jgi:hypothetical protein
MGDDPMALLGLEGALKHYYLLQVLIEGGRDVCGCNTPMHIPATLLQVLC